MAGVDHSIYFQQQPLDIIGNVQRGLEMGHAIKQRKFNEAEQQRLQLERQNQADVQKAYQTGIIQNPDGTTGYDIGKVNTALGAMPNNPYAGEALYKNSNQMFDRDLSAKKYADSLAQQERDNIYRDKALASAAADRAEARNERRFQAGVLRDEKQQALQTPYGLANTPDDAKQLKEAHEAKKNFDNKLQQMIDLREKHGGGAIFNRDDVARGKQLSKDLLLEYKNMAKLGVLSKSDEDIINAIIPEDPLQYNSPLASVQGQDPTLSRLKSFKDDSDKDFQTRIGTRTRAGIMGQAPQNAAPPMGAMQDGFVFTGGNPADPKSWRKL